MKLTSKVFACLLASSILFMAGCSSLNVRTMEKYPTFPTCTCANDIAISNGPHVRRIIQIILENSDLEDMARNDFFSKFLPAQGATLTDFHGVTHPSFPNYLAMVSGQTLVTGTPFEALMTGDLFKAIQKMDFTPRDTPKLFNECTVGDLLAAKSINWVNYAENFPESADGCFSKTESEGDIKPKYYRRHVPFMNFPPAQRSSSEHPLCPVVNAASMAALNETQRSGLPQYIFYSPNGCHDGHDHCTPEENGTSKGLASNEKEDWNETRQSSVWLKTFINQFLADPKFMAETLIIISYDEAESEHVMDYKTNLSRAWLIGGGVAKESIVNDRFDHYSVLKLVENNFGLCSLSDNDKGAADLASKLWEKSASPR